MWKDEIKKQRSNKQQLRMEALDFADDILDIIKKKLSRSRIDLPKDRRLEFRQTLRELFLEAADLE